MNKYLSYFKGSFFRIALELNPFQWEVYFSWVTTSNNYPGLIVDCRAFFGPVRFDFTIDNLDW